jgi:hypothetical protein
MRIKFITLVALILASLGAAGARAEVTVEKNERGAAVKIDGKLFTEYLTKAGHEPALYPVIGPTGTPVTRSYPFTPPVKNGTKDHPHHHSLWMTHGEVNGNDFWGTNVDDDKGDKKGLHIAHREFVKVASTGDKAEIVTRNDWMKGDKRICDDERTLVFGSEPDGSRWIDFTTTIHANDGDVTFGDTKEGSFALRVADSMRVDAKAGGHIVNSEKQSNAAAWGQPARWVDYTGPVEGETVGIAMMSHPKSYHPTPRWHVRTYGLFAANPFGEKDFPNPEAADQGAVTIKKGDSLTLKYRVWLHKGDTNVEALERAYRDFASE